MKPTYGRVSRYGIVAFASSLDQIGPFARDARDAAALLHAVAGRDDRDSTSSPTPVPDALLHLPAGDDEAAATLRGKRLGLPREYFVAGMEPGVEARIREAVAALEAAGAIVEEVSLPHTEYGLATYYIVAPAEASANLARYDGIRYGPRLGEGGDVLAGYLATRGQGFGAEVKRRIMLGTYALSAGYYDAYYLKAQKVRTLIKGDFDALWAQGFDALVAPTSPTVAFRFGARMDDPVAMYLSDACTLPVNMAGLPGISVPAGLSEGLPVGLQFIGAPWSEPALLGLARGYEALTADADWRRLEPPGLAALDDPAATRPPALGDLRPASIGPSGPRPRAIAGPPLVSGGVPWACVRSCSARPSGSRPASARAGLDSGGRPGASPRMRHPSRCPAMPSCPTRWPSRPEASPSMRHRRPSGRGSCRWATDGPAGTATTSSTSAVRAPTRSSRLAGPRRSATSCRPIPAAASRSSSWTPSGRWSCAATRPWSRPRRRPPPRHPMAAPGPGPIGVQASGAILGSTPQDFAASWAFVLEPVGEGKTRLIERFRVWYGEGSPAARFVMPFVGFGVFVMLQRQMTGIRERAEQHPEPSTGNGHQVTPADLVAVATG